MPCRQELLSLCGIHICPHESLPTALVHPPEEYTSISHRLVFFCTERHRRTGTYLTDGLLSQLLPTLRGVLLSEGNELSAVPMPQPTARQHRLPVSLQLQEHLLLRQEPEVLGGAAAHRQPRLAGGFGKPYQEVLAST